MNNVEDILDTLAQNLKKYYIKMRIRRKIIGLTFVLNLLELKSLQKKKSITIESEEINEDRVIECFEPKKRQILKAVTLLQAKLLTDNHI